MPAKNTVKVYVENSYYHLYNRGVAKQKIFRNQKDYLIFLHILKRYLAPSRKDMLRPLKTSNLCKNIKLLSYCLLPNHFHLLVKQKTLRAITEFMRRVNNSYVKYFNERYKRVGPLFQGRYKAVIIETEAQLLHLSRYIHLNPLVSQKTSSRSDLKNNHNNTLISQFSSYEDYVGKRKTSWLDTEEILQFFKMYEKSPLGDIFSYQSFVENYQEDSVKGLTLGEIWVKP